MKKCICTFRQRLVGDGCDYCNTTESIKMTMPTPVEMAEILKDDGFFSDDQAEVIASEIYQPLINYIEILSTKIDGKKR